MSYAVYKYGLYIYNEFLFIIRLIQLVNKELPNSLFLYSIEPY
ncbi:hypothetical protein VCRA2126O85_20047 [Vibrio crassostreae]|nr:hypothetical protein VCRA2127O91_20049 [Vibrio crassostreae]CAK2824292.1 hypothetical protein VCRA2126O86_20047 [Vibrio crassostreae]CAK2828630.1 hypothetical protein VCRA2126O85_20047 [Vibrio crassostreae]CAK2830188.1 hypothetical protein VCRA2125O83_20049 [Vibrio crassostreae]CAK2918544.1 hypothetical protein VCRA2128O106_30022 [Vibrio crassostreae]